MSETEGSLEEEGTEEEEGPVPSVAEAPPTAPPPREVVAEPPRGSGLVRLAGWFGILAAIIGIGISILGATILCGPGCGTGSLAEDKFAPDGSYDWYSNALSDLGVSQVAPIFNYSLILVGILTFIFTIGFVRAYAENALYYAGGAILILGGGSLSLVGVFTAEAGDLHGYVSLGYFVLFPVAIVVVGVAFARTGPVRRGYASVLAGLIALVVILTSQITEWHRTVGIGFGVPETIEALILAAWIAGMGASLARS